MKLINDNNTSARQVLTMLTKASVEIISNDDIGVNANNFVLLNIVSDRNNFAPIIIADFMMPLLSKTIIKNRQSPPEAINSIVNILSHSIRGFDVNAMGIAFYLNGHLNVITESNNGVRLAKLMTFDISPDEIKTGLTRDIQPPEGKGMFFPEHFDELDSDGIKEVQMLKKVFASVFENEFDHEEVGDVPIKKLLH